MLRTASAFLCAIAASAAAQPFQLIATITPPGSNADPNNWQPTWRFAFSGTTGAAPFRLADLPARTEVFDPAGVCFRHSDDLFIGNRHGNVIGQGSISRFHLSPDGTTATYLGNFTTPGMIGVHEVSYCAETDTMIAATVFDGLYRFSFDAQAQPVFQQHYLAGHQTRGVQIHPNGRYVFTTEHSGTVFIYSLAANGTLTPLAPLNLPGASNLHFFCLSTDGRHLYACDIGSSKVYRMRLGTEGQLTHDLTVVSPGAVDCAFSFDGQEMFVGDHFGGSIHRFTFDANADDWIPGGVITTPSMGGFGTYNAPPCIADFNFDGFVDFFDMDAYVACFEGAACPPARDPDFNGDGFTDFLDMDEFITQFERGC